MAATKKARKRPATKAKPKANKQRPAKKAKARKVAKRVAPAKFGNRRTEGVYDRASLLLMKCKTPTEMLSLLAKHKSPKVATFRERLRKGQPLGPWRMHLGNHLRALLRLGEIAKRRAASFKKSTKRPKATTKPKATPKRKAARPTTKAAKKR